MIWCLKCGSAEERPGVTFASTDFRGQFSAAVSLCVCGHKIEKMHITVCADEVK